MNEGRLGPLLRADDAVLLHAATSRRTAPRSSSLDRRSRAPCASARPAPAPQHTDSAFYRIIGQMKRAAALARDDSTQLNLDKLDGVLSPTDCSPRCSRCRRRSQLGPNGPMVERASQFLWTRQFILQLSVWGTFQPPFPLTQRDRPWRGSRCPSHQDQCGARSARARQAGSGICARSARKDARASAALR